MLNHQKVNVDSERGLEGKVKGKTQPTNYLPVTQIVIPRLWDTAQATEEEMNKGKVSTLFVFILIALSKSS